MPMPETNRRKGEILMRNTLRLHLLVVVFLLLNATSSSYATPIKDNGATGLNLRQRDGRTDVVNQWYDFQFGGVGSSFAPGIRTGHGPTNIRRPQFALDIHAPE